MLRKLTWISILTYLHTFLFTSEGQVCSDFTSPNDEVLYRISTEEVNYTEALSQGKLLSIEDPETQALISAQMVACNVTKVWLKIRQVAASKQTSEAQIWAWVPDCCHSSCDRADSLLTQYMGCYDESLISNSLRDLSHPSGIASVSVTSCIQACRNLGYSFAGVHVDNGHHCYCDNTFGHYGSADRCGLTCPGDSSQSCGYYGQNAIYATKDNTQWAKWADDQPNNFGGFQYCAVLSQSSNYLLSDEQCKTPYNYICEMESDVSGPSCQNLSGFSNDTASNAESCYYISETSSSWYQAKQICRENRGRLAFISSDSEHDVIKSWLNDFSFTHIWVGLYRNTFVTVEGENSSFSCYTHFANDEPSQASSSYVYINSRASYYWQTTSDLSFLAATVLQMANPCANNPCGENGQCSVGLDTFSCRCNQGWSGERCNEADLSTSAPGADSSTISPALNTETDNSVNDSDTSISGDDESKTPEKQESDDNGSSTWWIIAAAVGSVILVVIFAGTALFFVIRKRQAPDAQPVEAVETNTIERQGKEETSESTSNEIEHSHEINSIARSGNSYSSDTSGESKF